jgi:AraC family transcriptional regulator
MLLQGIFMRTSLLIKAACPTGPLTLAELALEAGLSEFHFARMFKQSTRQAPHQYVMQRRMVRAETLVRHSPLSLTEIAMACG